MKFLSSIGNQKRFSFQKKKVNKKAIKKAENFFLYFRFAESYITKIKRKAPKARNLKEKERKKVF